MPGRNLCAFLTPPVEGVDLRAALEANCFRGALPPVDLRAVRFFQSCFPLSVLLSCRNFRFFFDDVIFFLVTSSFLFNSWGDVFFLFQKLV